MSGELSEKGASGEVVNEIADKSAVVNEIADKPVDKPEVVNEVADKPEVVNEVADKPVDKPYVEEKVLATIEVILNVTKHPMADSLWIVRVQGYDVIINLEGMFGPEATASPQSIIGRKVIYCQIDSIFPNSFDKQGFWNYLDNTYMGRRLKSVKIRKIVSQGLVIDFNSMRELFPNIDFASKEPGYNLTNEMGIVKYYSIYDVDGPAYFGASDKYIAQGRTPPNYLRQFPMFIPKTDQERLQRNISLISNSADRLYTATIKVDGQSVQWFKNKDKIGLCSRNYEVLLDYDKAPESRDKSMEKFRHVQEKYNIFDGLAKLNRNISIQTELYGESINGNRLRHKGVDIVCFDIFDIDKQQFLQHSEVVEICKIMNIPMPAIIFENKPLLSDKIEPWIELANSLRYPKGQIAEGLVCRSSDGKSPYISFKVISPEFLLKYNL